MYRGKLFLTRLFSGKLFSDLATSVISSLTRTYFTSFLNRTYSVEASTNEYLSSIDNREILTLLENREIILEEILRIIYVDSLDFEEVSESEYLLYSVDEELREIILSAIDREISTLLISRSIMTDLESREIILENNPRIIFLLAEERNVA